MSSERETSGSALTARLRVALAAGVTDDPRTGEVSDAITAVLLQIGACAEHIETEFTQELRPDLADAFETQIPRHHVTSKTDTQQGGDNPTPPNPPHDPPPTPPAQSGEEAVGADAVGNSSDGWSAAKPIVTAFADGFRSASPILRSALGMSGGVPPPGVERSRVARLFGEAR